MQTALAPGDTLTALSADTASFPVSEVTYSDSATFGCDYQIPLSAIPTPPASLPDASYPIALIAVGLLGGTVALRRRRRA